MFRVGLLKISAPDFIAGNLRCDSKHRNPAAVTIVEPVDQMQIARAATSRANGQLPGKMRFRASGKRRRLFMSYMHPLNLLVCANRIRDAIERVPRYAVHSPNSRFSKNIHQQVGDFFLGHKLNFIEAGGKYQNFPDGTRRFSMTFHFEQLPANASIQYVICDVAAPRHGEPVNPVYRECHTRQVERRRVPEDVKPHVNPTMKYTPVRNWQKRASNPPTCPSSDRLRDWFGDNRKEPAHELANTRDCCVIFSDLIC